MRIYTIQVSNHPHAADLPIPEAAISSWQTVYDGPIATEKEAREATTGIAQWFRHARLFKCVSPASSIGHLIFEIARRPADEAARRAELQAELTHNPV